MARTLQEILCGPALSETIARVAPRAPVIRLVYDPMPPEEWAELKAALDRMPVHKLENVDDDPTRVRTLCHKYAWRQPFSKDLIDPNAPAIRAVTCPGCLEAMSDIPTVVET